LQFDNKIGSIQQILTATNVGVLRRQAILKELNLKKNQQIIDIGCGGGHLVEEISMSIGPSGKAIGVDPSEFQIKTAKERCKHLPNVQLLCSNANDINIEHNSCDAVTFTQTLEYIDNVDEALFAAKKLQKPMSIFVNVSTLWDFFGFHGPEKELNDMMHQIYRGQKHPMLPTQLNGKLEKLGYTNIKTQEIPFFITNKDENSFPKFHEILMVNAAIKKGVSEDLVYKWQNQLHEAEENGKFAFTVISILTSAFSNS
jgi:ubiquinone/menaquinone biosynthesis C-methylase UbiE